MEDLINERDMHGLAMQYIHNEKERRELFNEIREIEEELYQGYGIYPIYTGFGWKPPTPRKYTRKPRVPVRQIYNPVLSSIPEDKAIYFSSSRKSPSTRSKRRSTRSKRRSTRSKRRS
jgi:hypothetical protein